MSAWGISCVEGWFSKRRGWFNVSVRIGGVCMLLFIFEVSVAAQSTIFTINPKLDTTVNIDDMNELYRIGFTAFESRSLSPELEYLQVSLPRLFSQEFTVVTTHFLDDEELDQYRYYLLQQAIDMIEQQLDGLIGARDQNLFSDSQANGSGAQQVQQDREIEKLQQQLIQLQEYDLTQIVVEQEKQIEVVNLTDEYTTGTPSYASIAQQHNLDIVFDGLIVQDNEFILVTIFFYKRAEGKIRRLTSVSVAQDELNLIPSLISDSLANVIVGREWSSIIITGLREQDSVYIDDQLIGYGSQTARYIPLGEHTVRFESEYNDSPVEQDVTLETKEPITVEFNLDAPELGRISIETEPSAATVYLNSTWQGETPLEIESAPTQRALLIRKPGYFDVRQELNSDSDSLLTYTLIPELFNQGEWLFTRRDRFYAALTAFIISVPIPIILSGVADNSAVYRNTSNYRALPADQQSGIVITQNVTQAGAYMGIFASVMLAVNAIIEAVYYINAADFFHRL